jgi:GT2 family glycosyltransferase
MKILAHIHTLNDEDVIDQAITSVLDQARPPDAILLVDNASTDRTLHRTFPDCVTVIRHEINTGTSGSVATGFRYALENGFDWIWILDADSLPQRDALATLVDLYASFTPEIRAQVGSIASRIVRGPTNRPDDYGILTSFGPKPATVDPTKNFYECDSGIWSGTLFNLNAIQAIQPPRFGPDGPWDDFALDWGDIEYFYRLHRAGYKIFVHKQSFIRHALGWQRTMKLFGRIIIATNHSAFRRYLYFRNGVYFWRFLYPAPKRWAVARYMLLHIASQVTKILILEDDRLFKIRAVARGAWDGYHKRLHTTY